MPHLIDYLPAIYQDDRFAAQFLQAFEQILLEHPGEEQTGISMETQIARVSRFFNPQETRKEFLSWLAGWVALSLRDDWQEDAQRRFIERIVPLYQKRGTKAGLEDILKTYTGVGLDTEGGVAVMDFPHSGFEIGDEDAPNENAAIVGVNTFVEGAPPFYFLVTMVLDTFDLALRDRKKQIAHAIIDQEKPAHTYYDLEVDIAKKMQIEVHSTIGVDTVLPFNN
jgi:phage tail-like protein